MRSRFSLTRQFTALLSAFAILLPAFSIGINGQTMQKASYRTLSEDQKIQHVLNRLGYGARLGDIEKVKALGLKNYIEQQLNPGSINDSVADAKVVRLDVLKLSNEELFAKYPNPAALLQIVSQETGLSRQQVQAARNQNQNQNQNNQGEMKPGEMPGPPQPANPDQMNAEDRQMVQKKIQEIYQKNSLGRPVQISQQLNASRILRAVYSEKQLQEVMVDFWTNHFNVYANKAAVRWFLPQYDRDVIRPNAMGNFKDLLLATAKSPAMLFYLDNFESVAPAQPQNQNANNLTPQQRMQRLQAAKNNPQIRERIKQQQGITDEELDRRIKQMEQNGGQLPQQNRQQRGINENYAREIMELHTLGVDGGYSQKDIQEVARCFTGWTIIDPRGYRRAAAMAITGRDDRRGDRIARQLGVPEDAESGTFWFAERFHDNKEKTVLGQTINEGGIKDGLKVIDLLVKHPSTAKFIARKLAIKFVNDTPSEALVARVADTFSKSDGDIKTTLRALFNDPEFFAPENYRAKIKTPLEVLVSGIRALGAETNGGPVQAMLGKLGEPLYGWQAPTGYPEQAEDWVNTGALLERMNFAVALASNRIPGTKVDLAKLGAGGGDKKQLLNKFIDVILQGDISDATRAALIKQLDQPLPQPSDSMAMNDEMAMENPGPQGAQAAQFPGRQQGQQFRLLPPSGDPETFKVVGLILGSPEFQRQ